MKFDDIIGNEDIKLQLQIAGMAARKKNTSIPHVLFAGAAGCGKTTMAKALAKSQNSEFLKIPPESMKSAKDALDLVDQLCVEGYTKEGDVVGQTRPTILFFDEVHQMPLKGQEVLGIAMEEWYMSSKNQYTGELQEYWLPRFTLVGATTLSGRLSKPFRDRFKLIFQFNTYDLNESVRIIKVHANLKGVQITEGGAKAIALRARGVPRTMVGYLERAADIVTVMGDDLVTNDSVNSIFKVMGIDNTGLLINDIQLMKSLYEAGVPVGLDTLSIILNESQETIKNSMEPYLIQRGYIMRTGRGRVITQKGIEYLKENNHIKSKRKFASA